MNERPDPWERRAEAFTDRPWWTTFKVALGVILLVLFLAVVTMPLGWGFAWLKTAAEVTGPANTSAQAYAIRDDYNSLKATAGNYCGAKAGQGRPTSNDPQLIGGDPSEQYAQTYRRIEADYNRRMTNDFEAGWINKYPFFKGLPKTAPTLDEMVEKLALTGC